MAASTQPVAARTAPILDLGVTEERVTEAVRRIIETADPLRIVVFGSRARGDHRTDSDLDLAVMVDSVEDTRKVTYYLLEGLRMPVDLLVYSRERHAKFSVSINSVHSYIDREGVVLYERNADRSPSRVAIAKVSGRPRMPELSAA
ncbi:MAG TPA: nucleotidyltransferase domain-containing protein [Granulicella sp.]|jgi:predicted nucleotidyltransferase